MITGSGWPGTRSQKRSWSDMVAVHQLSAEENLKSIAGKIQKELLPQQHDAWKDARACPTDQPYRVCLFYKTGAAKTLTSLICMYARGADDLLVVAPPATHGGWQKAAATMGLQIETVSHAKFRQPGFKISRTRHVIVDEFHMLGGQKASGWSKLNRLAAGSRGDIIICSATPNYNDAERCYCVQKIIDPRSVAGGYINFIYQHCITRPNAFGTVPLVDSFRDYKSAAEYLGQLDRVLWVPDDVEYKINDLELRTAVDPQLEWLGVDTWSRRIVASAMEMFHAQKRRNFLRKSVEFQDYVYEELSYLVGIHDVPVMMYCDSAAIARALHEKLQTNGVTSILVTGAHTREEKLQKLKSFIAGDAEVLVGTASIATGPDGLDKVCNMLIIVDDTQDDSLRRQLIGRILPRGTDTDMSKKVIYRLTFS